jgi:ATP-dependent DNA helicase RecG
MRELGLRVPIIEERENGVLIRILHEPLASPEETIKKYLETHETIRNKQAREITFIKDPDHMKRILQKMAAAGEIRKIGIGGGQAYRRKENDQL